VSIQRHIWNLTVWAIAVVSFATSLALGAAAQVDNAKRDQKQFSRTIDMGTSHAKILDTCLVLHSSLSGSDFFAGLKVRHASNSVEFRKGNVLVNEFPPILTVEMLSFALECSTPNLEKEEKARAALDRLLFKVEWKRGLVVRPAQDVILTIRKPSPEEWAERDEVKRLSAIGMETSLDGFLVVELTIKTNHVPLTDSLVVTVSTTDSNQIARFSARL